MIKEFFKKLFTTASAEETVAVNPKTEKEQKQIATTEIRNSINALKRIVKAGAITKQQFEQQKTALTNLKKK